MTFEEFQQQAYKLIRQGENEAALDWCFSHLNDGGLQKQLIEISAQLADLNKPNQVFALDYKEITGIKARLRDSLMNLVEQAKNITGLFEQPVNPQAYHSPSVSTPVFFSCATPHNDEQKRVMNHLYAYMKDQGIELCTTQWSVQNPLLPIRQRMQDMRGCVVLAMERAYSEEMVFKPGSEQEKKQAGVRLPSTWNQLEPAMAYQLGLPLLILKEASLWSEGMLESGVHEWKILTFDVATIRFDESPYQHFIASWIHEVRQYSPG